MYLYEAQEIVEPIISKLSDKDLETHFWEIGEQLWCQIFIEGSLK
jgi:hypothetical protein